MGTKEWMVVGGICSIILVALLVGFFWGGNSVEQSTVYLNGVGVDYQGGTIRNALIFNGVELTDHTIFDLETNTCTASNLGMEIRIEDCNTEVLYPADIRQYVDFTWNGGSPQDTSWVFVYEGDLERGGMRYWNPNVNHTEIRSTHVLQWVGNYVVDNVVSYENLGEPDLDCDDGSHFNNTQMYEVVRNEAGGQTNRTYCFTNVTPINATTFSLAGWADAFEDVEIVHEGSWLDVPVEYMGSDLLGNGFSYYQVQNVTFQPDQTIRTEWTYTPEGNAQSGKWHILGYAGQGVGDLVDAVAAEQYIYMDPSWEPNLNNGIISYWTFNETTGDLIDRVAGVYNGTVTGGITQGYDGKIGTAYKSSGSGTTNVNVGAYTAIEGIDTLTINFWVNSTGGTPTDSIIRNKDTSPTIAWLQRPSGDISWVTDGGSAVDCLANTDLQSGGWHMITTMYNGTDAVIYQDGSFVDSCSQSGNIASSGEDLYFFARNGGSEQWNGVLDEGSIWNRTLNDTEIGQLYNGGDGISYTNQFAPTSALTVELLTPADSTVSSSNIFNFTANQTATGDLNNTNATIFIWNSTSDLVASNTTSLSGNGSALISWNVTGFTDGDYDWNVFGCAENSTGSANCTWAYNGNFTFEVDTSQPVLNLTTPINDLFVENTDFPQSVVLNYTATDPNLESCWYYTNNNATNQTITCNTNASVSFSNAGEKTIFYYANDTLGNENNANVSFEIGTYTQSVDVNPIGEGQQAEFSLTLNKTGIGLETLNATLVYNNTNYAYDVLNIISNDYVEVGRDLVIPDGTGNATGRLIFWNWNFTGSSSGAFSASQQNQTVYSVDIDDCSTLGEVILNMSLRDETTQQFVNTTAGSVIELDLELTSKEDGAISWQYSNTWTNNETAVVCVPSGLLTASEYRIDFVAEYGATDHVTEFYYLDNGTLSSSDSFNSLTNKTINLYDLELDDSTTFLFSFLDNSNLEVPNAIVHVFRQYIGEGVFKEVERGKQDDNGETHLHLVEEDVIYFFVISEDSEILFTSSTYNAKCLSTPCSIELEASPDFEEFPTDWDLMPNGTFTVTDNAATRTANLAFSSTTPTLMNLTVAKQDYQGDVTLIGSSATTATSGNLSVVVPAAAGNVTYYAIVYRDNSYIAHSLVDFTDTTNYYGATGGGMGFLLVIALVLMGATEGILFFVFLIFALIVVAALALVKLGYYALIGFICAMGILIYKLIRRGRTYR